MATVITLLALGAAGLVQCQSEDMAICGSAPYYASDYTCYDNATLCPTLYGQPTHPCSGACYSPDMYQCRDGQLQLLPTDDASGPPFKLEVHSPNPALNNRRLNVCGLQFHAGEGAETCVYCYNAPPQFVCSSYQNETVLMPSGAMSVDVPGSQSWFIDPETGRLRTTAAGKAGGYGREYAGKGVTVYKEGYFSHHGLSYWLVCKEPGEGQLYGIFAPMGGSDGSDCERIKLATVPSAGPKEGAYAYT